MKKSRLKVAGFMMLAMLLGGYGTATAQNENCDLNGDGRVDVADMSYLIDAMAGNAEDQTAEKNASRNKLSESFGEVDLGLPSGRIWANKNLGYSKDADFGMYFAWGEFCGTVAKGQNVKNGYVLENGTEYVNKKTRYDWANYEWMQSDESTWQFISKYQIPDGEQNVCWYDEVGMFAGDNLNTLTKADDAAEAATGGKWRMPTIADIEELLEFTTQTWKEGKMDGGSKNVWGCEFKGPNGKTIFLPAAGDIEYQYVEYREGQYPFPRGKYWSKELGGHFGHNSSTAGVLSINRKHGIENVPENMLIFYERQYGLSIRPVKN